MFSIFNFLKKFFSWVDENPRKRHASNDLSEIYYCAPKKHCNYGMNYVDLENDESPRVRRRQALDGINGCTPKVKPASVKRRSRHDDSESSFQSYPRLFKPPTTLHSTTALLEKQKYNDMLQFYNYEKRRPHHICRESEKENVQEVEIIELDQTEEPRPSRRSTAQTSSRSPARTPKAHIRPRQPIAIVQLDDDDDVIALPQPIPKKSPKSPKSPNSDVEIIKVNSFREKLANKAILQSDYTSMIKKKYSSRQEILRKRTEEQEKEANAIAKQNSLNREAKLSEHLAKSLRLVEPFLDEQEEPEEPALPKLTAPMLDEVKVAWSLRAPRPLDEVLADNFGLKIKRRDMQTLAELNWLNDEVINFYMNLLIERGKQEKFPNVYAMNTFFYVKLVQSGHSSLKRWTRKVDIFAQDLVVVPIHLGIHWCMSIIDFRDKSIRYYDSMGGNNHKCLTILRQYLEEESLDKKKKPYDTSDWKLECVKKIPQQMNGSDCGVFSCMFAEYISANKRVTFSQDDMPYFRCKMVYEILHSKLL